MNNKYHKGKIYTIRSYQTDKFYIGSTCDLLHKRLYKHRINNKCINGSNVSSSIILDYEDHYIELLEEFKCDNKAQLLKREGELIRLHKEQCVNKNMAGRTLAEYRKDNKEKIKQYYEDNKEQIRQYYEDNKEKIKQYSKDNIERRKQYLEDNKEKIKVRCKKYREDNYKYTNCNICGGSYDASHLKRHLMTARHKKYIENT